jgi:hypothetical protein
VPAFSAWSAALAIGQSRQPCAVEIIDKAAQSVENPAIALSLAGAGFTGQDTQ